MRTELFFTNDQNN